LGTALEYLKQNQVAKALPLLAQALDLVPKNDDFAAALLGKLRRLERYQKEILAKSNSSAAADLRKKLNKIQSRLGRGFEKADSADFFDDLQQVLDKNQERFDFVRETLTKLPEYMEIANLESWAGNKTLGLLSLDPTIQELQKQITLLLSLSAELANKTFIQESWTVKVMNNLRQILEQYILQAGANEQCIQSFPETMVETAIGFVMANNRAFSKPFKRSFYENKLRSLGIAVEWLKEPSFFDVVIQARAIEKNSQGFWQAAFAEDLTMIYIPRGFFTMGVPWESGGADDESPQHEVELNAYWIAKNETTFIQYDRFCEDTDRELPSDFDKGRKKRPVIGISYQNAVDYCQWLTFKTGVLFRLPTEAEWEKAAKGSDKRKYPWGNTDPKGSLGNFADLNFLEYYQQTNPPANETEKQQMRQWIAETTDDGHIFTAPVGTYPKGASPCGALDMAGNVWEWVADWYDGNYYQKSPRQNPLGSSGGIYRVVRGGGWDCHPWMLRSTSRSGAPPSPNKGSETIGFRVAASPLPTTQK
jgi:sulfatase modifying factor 1